jgi:hypothetical protein
MVACWRLGAVGDLAEAPFAAAPVAGQLDEGEAVRRGAVDDVAGEVHGRGA